jgi:hypothetical protein
MPRYRVKQLIAAMVVVISSVVGSKESNKAHMATNHDGACMPYLDLGEGLPY